MTSTIRKLQGDSINSDVSVAELLRASYMIACRLQLQSYSDWARLELDGYGLESIPTYRKVDGVMRVNDTFYGYQPLHQKGSNETGTDFSVMSFNQSVGEIESILASAQNSGDNELLFTYTPDVEKLIKSCMNSPRQPLLCIHTSSLSRVLDAVRNKIVIWLADLEASGVTGDISVNMESDLTDARNVDFRINTYIAGNVSGDQVQIASPNSQQVRIDNFDPEDVKLAVNTMLSYRDASNLDSQDLETLNINIEALRLEAGKSEPNSGVIVKALASAKTIVEGAAGNLLGSGLLGQINSLLGV